MPVPVDVAVVGAGTAGCIVAARLAGAGRSVLLLEDGPAALPGPEVTSLAQLPVGGAGDRVVRCPEVRGRPVVRGRGLGGSSCVNGGYFLRAHPDDFARWPAWWTPSRIADAYDALDGGDPGGGLLSVTPFDDDELGDVPRAFENYWGARLGAASDGVWPRPGLVRVRSNRVDGRRLSTAEALLLGPERVHAPGRAGGVGRRPGLTIRGGSWVESLVHDGRRVTGVRAGGTAIAAGEVILCAGALGTAALLQRSGLLAPMGVRALIPREHAERVVRFTPRREVAAPALLQSVVHTDAGIEIRCYGDDFARFIGGLEPRGVPIGVSDMAHPARGSVVGTELDLGEPDEVSAARMSSAVDAVVDMLDSPEFCGLVVPGSISVDSVTGMSQHASGTLPLGSVVDHLGGALGVSGLRVVDGSVVPGGLRSGPHATIAMAAWAIAGEIA
ncbi:mycofactocin system GMC family oxidoreductase MftG [Gordonia iterans]|uniref:Mycofactocin system GMC family oxidoreductase MftG n=1 Tax=Gordonia iterans TaxID=1004901 RepID=A0A2S0KIP7_9ACTN|nr:mycofactocin system GMC family oxidoreductase MftG [Gordonia iterans]AVM01555.1 mycofactocin system GMC family oxidoreductase MftG [Gordonia iterans]